MNKDLLNILSNSNKDISNQQLMDYLAGKLPEADKHAIEQELSDDAFLNDAAEGLSQVSDPQQIDFFVEQLNRDLLQKVQNKKKRRRRPMLQQRWVYAGIVLILALLLAAFLMITKYQALKH